MKLKAYLLDPGPLTKKESEILRLLCQGLIRSQIAALLCRSIKTVNTHIEHIQDKLQAANTHHVVMTAVAKRMVRVYTTSLCLVLCFSALSFDDSFTRARTRLPKPTTSRIRKKV